MNQFQILTLSQLSLVNRKAKKAKREILENMCGIIAQSAPSNPKTKRSLKTILTNMGSLHQNSVNWWRKQEEVQPVLNWKELKILEKNRENKLYSSSP